MKRLALLFGCLFLLASPASATSDFSKAWKAKYYSADGVSDEFKSKVKSASCYVCHIKKHPDKKKARNEYGKAVHKYLKEKDFPKEWVKANPEEAKAKMLEGFKKANQLKNKDGQTFEARIKADELPTDDYTYEEE